MRSDVDESDLYPPDAENHELTPDAKHHRMRAAVGATLLVWGTSLMIQLATGVDLDTFMLGLGVGALAGWTQVRRYSWFVAGAIATGLGAAEVAGAMANDMFASTIASLAIAAGFAAIYVRYPRRSMWALVPAGIMVLVAAGAFGIGLIGLLPEVLGRFLLPLLLVAGGGLLLLRNSLPPKTVKIGLAAIAATFVLVGANTASDIDVDRDVEPITVPNFGPLGAGGSEQTLPLGPGDTLEIRGDDSIDIEFRRAEKASIELVSDRDIRPLAPRLIDIQRQDRTVVVETNEHFARNRSLAYVVSLPAGVNLDISRGSGKVTGTLAGASGDITTKDGDVELKLENGGPEGIDGDGPLEIDTGSGSVSIDSGLLLDLDLDLDGEGDILVNGESRKGGFQSPAGTRGVEVEVDTGSGNIEIDMPQPPAVEQPAAA